MKVKSKDEIIGKLIHEIKIRYANLSFLYQNSEGEEKEDWLHKMIHAEGYIEAMEWVLSMENISFKYTNGTRISDKKETS
tara:strand:- start:652 stop:891 length:240 start_codon:yes stop_codon:yes gene_type:complete